MIVLINGPFGVGKTTTALLLVERLPNALLYDPEVLGAVLRHSLSPIHEVKDFQDYDLWPKMTVEMARMLREEYRRDLVVPMTLWRRDRLEELSDGFRDLDPDFRVFQLTAPKSELQRRIMSDLEDEQARPWRMAHMENGLAMLGDPAFGEEFPTDGRMPGEVVEGLLGKLTTSHPASVSP